MSKLVSIVITNYNYGKYISKAINSVFRQSYPNIELIIINDGSTDNSDDVIREIIGDNPDKNIRYIDRSNKGVVYTRNEGMRLARGEYICFLDADDYFNRDYISKSYKIALESGADVIYPNWHFVGEWLGRPDTNFPEFDRELLQLQRLHVTPASLIKKSAVKHHKFVVEKVAEDWDFFIGLSLDGAKFKLAEDNYINYRIRSGTRGSKNDPLEDTKCFVEILEKYRKEYGDLVIDPKKLVSLRHPSLIRRILTGGYIGRFIGSVQRYGLAETLIKIVHRLVSKISPIRKALFWVRDSKYSSLQRSYNINSTKNSKLAVIVHLFYVDTWQQFRDSLSNIDVPFDLYITVQERDKDFTVDRVSKYHRCTNVVPLPNRGRDVLPFIVVLRIISSGPYKYLLKLHSKKSPHRSDGNKWMTDLLKELVPTDVSKIVSTLAKSDTGAVGPASHVVSLSRYMGGNRNLFGYVFGKVADKNKVDHVLINPQNYPFFGGTMFWCRLDFVEPLVQSNLSPSDFNTERGQVDTTTAHAVERLLGGALHYATNKKMYVTKNGKVRLLPNRSYQSVYKYVD